MASQANITHGALEQLATTLGSDVAPEDLFAYAYGILAQRAYVERFWDELELPPPRLPITKDGELFHRVADLGRRLLHLHTYGQRFAPKGRAVYLRAMPAAQRRFRSTTTPRASTTTRTSTCSASVPASSRP